MHYFSLQVKVECLQLKENKNRNVKSEMVSSDFFAIDKKTHGIRVVGDGASVDFFTNKIKKILQPFL